LAGGTSGLASKLEAFINQAKINAVKVLTHQLVYSTPIDTGNARGNWIVTIGEPSTEYFKRPNRLSPGRSPESAILEANDVSTRAQFHDDIYISNNAPYIVRLNEGSSPQAGAGFVESAVAQLSVTDITTAFTGGPELG
jgi:hypothetical protein